MNAPACPRCGYDQSGVIATWRECCPLEGVCSECGLEFRWRDALNPGFADLPDFFEHSRSRRLRSLWITGRRTLRPRRFWNWIGLEQRVRLSRAMLAATMFALFVHLAAGVLSLGLLFVTAWIALESAVMSKLTQLLVPWLRIALCWPLDLSDWGAWPTRDSAFALIIPGAAAPLLIPLSFPLVRDTLRAVSVRPAHIVRVSIYSIPFAVLAFAVWGGIILVMGIAGELASLGMLSPSAFALVVSLTPSRPWLILLGAVFVALACARWWMCACRHYLRLPQPRAVGATMVFLTFLALFTLVMASTDAGEHLFMDY